MRICVFGGTGATGRLLVEQAITSGHDVVVHARAPSKLGALAEQVTLVEGTLDDAQSIDRAVRGSAAVISLLGPSRIKADGPPLVTGTEHIVQAMRDRGVDRLVAVATPSAPDPTDGRDLRLRLMVLGIKLTLRTAYNTIRAIDHVVRSSDLDWTIVRVPLLTDGPGRVARARRVGEPGGLRLDRQALAAFLLAQLHDRSWARGAPLVSNR